MTKKELVKLLDNFIDDAEVCVEDHSTGALQPIEAVYGVAEKESSQFLVRIEICGSRF